MKKIYNLLAAVVLMITGATAVQAQYWKPDYQGGDITAGTPNVQAIVPGTPYALLCSNIDGSEGQYLCNAGKSAAITDSCLFVFEVAGENTEGETVYMLKRNTDGKYLQNDEGVKFTTDAEEAYRFTAGKADWVAKEEIAELSFEDLWAAGFTKYVSTCPMGDDVWVFPSEDFNTDDPDTYTYFAGWWGGNSPAFWSYIDTNAWKVVPVYEAKGAEWLSSLLAEYFPSGFSYDAYAPGENPGQCDQALLDACNEAYNACYDLMVNESTDDAACRAAGEALIAAYEALIASVKPIGPGYYYFVNWRTDGHAAAIYASDAGVYWNYTELPEAPTVETAAYVWQLIQSEEDPNIYYLKNYKTGKYIGGKDGLSQVLPQVDEPFGYNVTYNTNNEENLAGYFNIANPKNPSTFTMHTQVAGKSLVYWYATAPASLWQVVTVDEADLEALKGEVEQAMRNDEMATLVADAQAAYKGARSYPSEATADGNFDDPGLVYDATQIASNATEPTEGSIEALLDGDFSTFYHSMWSTAPDPNDWHNMQFDLGEELSCFALKYAKRDLADSHGAPQQVEILGCNDADMADLTTGTWESEGLFNLTYTYTVEYASGAKDNYAGITGIELSKPYRYIRMVVKKTGKQQLTSGYPFWYLSEIRLYPAQYDAVNSTLAAIPEEIVNNLLAAIAKAQGELANNAATQATLDELEAAYEAWVENYPDPTVLTDLLAQAQALVDNAAIGDEIGYYPQSAVDALQAVINEVTPQVKTVMSLDEINPLKEQLRAAITAFNNSLAIPAQDAIYYIESASEGKSGFHRLFANGSGTNVNIKHGYYTLPEGEEDQTLGSYDANMESRLDAMWTIIKNEDGSVSFRNLATGLYMANPMENNAAVKQVAEPDSFVLRGAPGLAGAFNVVMTDGVYLNAQPNGNGVGNMVTWNTAEGADNSAFKFIEAEMPMSYVYDFYEEARVLTLPIDVMPYLASGAFYNVEGQKDGQLYLVPNSDETIKAGTPVIYVPTPDMESYAENFFLEATSPEEIVYNYTPFEVNGLMGVVDTVTVKDIAILSTAKIRMKDVATTVSANTGYFKYAPALDAPTGEVSFKIEGTLPSEVAIGSLEINPIATVDVYTISGVRLRSNVKGGVATRNLPAGLYIIGGKKVLVK